MLAHCDSCQSTTEHEVVKHRGSEYLLRCTRCGQVRHEVRQKQKTKPLWLVISRYEQSQRVRIELPADEQVSVGEVIDAGGEKVRITAIDTPAGRVAASEAEHIHTLWGVSLTIPLRVKYSVHISGRTVSGIIETTRSRVFRVGERVVTPRHAFIIHRIKTRTGILRRGSARASEVVRLYGRPGR